ncbi:hypothetical protein EDC96DRAFT_576683 [Choanephora cucurbitarum]|nr:hypothetical protein EDC96DRAFT_576683 [Choanephora cucurbitarum]
MTKSTSAIHCPPPNETTPWITMAVTIKPLNLQGGQCTWCGKYGHKKKVCPLLK